MSGPFADPKAVEALNHQKGTDRAVLVQYADWISGFLTGDLGQSYACRSPVARFLGVALLNSAKLAAVAFVLVVRLGISGGVMATLYQGRAADRILSVVALLATLVPEFVSGIVLILIFGVWLRFGGRECRTRPQPTSTGVTICAGCCDRYCLM